MLRVMQERLALKPCHLVCLPGWCSSHAAALPDAELLLDYMRCAIDWESRDLARGPCTAMPVTFPGLPMPGGEMAQLPAPAHLGISCNLRVRSMLVWHICKPGSAQYFPVCRLACIASSKPGHYAVSKTHFVAATRLITSPVPICHVQVFHQPLVCQALARHYD